MPEIDDRACYVARAAKALKLAELVSDPELAAIHMRMAKTYRELAELTPEGQRTNQTVTD